MIYRYDQPVDMPVPELYDTGIMNAYLSAVKEQYDKGEKRLDDFISKYGDFKSPFAKDVQTWDDLTMGRINNIYNSLVEQGIDPLRSREGQAIMAQAIRQTPTATLNNLKQSATVGEEYLKNKAQLQAQGLYSQDLEDMFMKTPFQDWSTTSDGVFDRPSAIQYKDLHSITSPWFKGIDKKYNDALTKKKNDGYDYYTVDENDLRGVIQSNLDDFMATPYGKFYYKKAQDIVKRNNPSADQSTLDRLAKEKLYEDMIDRNSAQLREEKKINEYALANYNDKLQRARQEAEWKHQERMEVLKQDAKGNKGSADAQNYHQDLLMMGLYSLSGKNDYKDPNVKSSNKLNVIKNAKTNIYNRIKDLQGKGEKMVARVEQITAIPGSHESMSLIINRFGNTGATSTRKIRVHGSDQDGLILTPRQATTVISRTNWAANTAGSRIKTNSTSHKSIKKYMNFVNNKGERVGYDIVFVPAVYNNVATTVNNKGVAIQANRGKIYAVNKANEDDYKDLGTAYLPFNYTSATSRDGKSRTNEFVTNPAYSSAIDERENRVRKVLGMKNTDKGMNIGDYNGI